MNFYVEQNELKGDREATQAILELKEEATQIDKYVDDFCSVVKNNSKANIRLSLKSYPGSVVIKKKKYSKDSIPYCMYIGDMLGTVEVSYGELPYNWLIKDEHYKGISLFVGVSSPNKGGFKSFYYSDCEIYTSSLPKLDKKINNDFLIDIELKKIQLEFDNEIKAKKTKYIEDYNKLYREKIEVSDDINQLQSLESKLTKMLHQCRIKDKKARNAVKDEVTKELFFDIEYNDNPYIDNFLLQDLKTTIELKEPLKNHLVFNLNKYNQEIKQLELDYPEYLI